MDTLTDEMYEVKQRKDGRWVVLCGKGMPQAGQPWKGTKDYATRALAIAAVKGQGRKESSYDRFLLDEEPEPVEWDNDSEGGMLGEAGDELLDNDEGEDDGEEEIEEVAKAIPTGSKTIIVLVLGGKGMLSE